MQKLAGIESQVRIFEFYRADRSIRSWDSMAVKRFPGISQLSESPDESCECAREPPGAVLTALLGPNEAHPLATYR
jgi:hypothetical protein